MKKLFPILFFLSFFFTQAQIKVKDTIIRRAKIKYVQTKNVLNFMPETPPLIPIAGAPKPSYTYLWEMGDGHYSREAQPKHIYKNKGNYNARVAVTNNYDNGKPPAARPQKVVVNEVSYEVYKDIASIEDQNGLNIQKNCDPIPDQEMVLVVSYQNMENYVSNGKLYLFYNEKQFKANNFELLNFRSHFGEREIKENTLARNDLDNSNEYIASTNNQIQTKKYRITTTETDLDATLLDANKTFKNSTVLEFDDMNPSETRNVFFTFKTTSEMIKDTSATITVRSVFVPNRSFKNHKIKNLEMEIVTSHDPNKMGSNGSFMNYRLVRFKTVNFKTRFQNNGEGPARMIRLETDIPDMFDKKTFKVVDMYPKCPICPKGEVPTTSCLDTIIMKNQIHFTFKNIYLPGSTQKNVKEIDSTKGFVKYSMKFGKDFHKIKTKSKTAIIFDKNEPIITNYATTRFLPGISIGVKIGYNWFPKLYDSRSCFLGATVSPFKSYRFYWQAEFLNSFHSYQSSESSEKLILPPQPIGTQSRLEQTTIITTNKNINWEIPLMICYNISNYISVGSGIQANINISEKSAETTTIQLFEDKTRALLLNKKETSVDKSDNFSTLKTGLIFDATFGAVRVGPSFGTRFVVNVKNNFNYLQFYGIWRF
jgi:hypothetical protein